MIHSFDQILVEPGCCLLIDLDDTILEFPGIDISWWNSVSADKWDVMMRTVTPVVIDPAGWHRLRERVTTFGGIVVIVTARPDSQSELTQAHLDTCGIRVDAVRHTREKGRLVAEYRKIYTNVVFVDDNLNNCADVAKQNKDVCVYPYMKPLR